MTVDANEPADSLFDRPAPAKERPRMVLSGGTWRRLFFGGIASISVFFTSLFCLDQYRASVAEQALQEAIAEADRLDPGWRLEEMKAAREIVPAAENAAAQVHKAGRTGIVTLNTVDNRGDLNKIAEEIETLAPNVRLPDDQAARLRAALNPLTIPRADARRIAEFSRGRFAFNTTPGFVDSLSHFDHAAIAVRTLANEAMQQIHDGESDEAWLCCRAIINIARAFGDEPGQTVQIVRARTAISAVRLIERTLAQGQVSDDQLNAMQQVLREEFNHPGLLITLRAQRAFMHVILSRVESGELRAADLQFMLEGNWLEGMGIRDEVRGFFAQREVKPAHAWMLRHLTQAVEIAKQPAPFTPDALNQHALATANAPPLARHYLPRPTFAFDLQRSQAQIGCALVGLAVERWRLRNGRWPDSLTDLIAQRFLDIVPANPYDGQPLRYRVSQEGVVIYAVGPEIAQAASPRMKASVDPNALGFRLWHANLR